MTMVVVYMLLIAAGIIAVVYPISGAPPSSTLRILCIIGGIITILVGAYLLVPLLQHTS